MMTNPKPADPVNPHRRGDEILFVGGPKDGKWICVNCRPSGELPPYFYVLTSDGMETYCHMRLVYGSHIYVHSAVPHGVMHTLLKNYRPELIIAEPAAVRAAVAAIQSMFKHIEPRDDDFYTGYCCGLSYALHQLSDAILKEKSS